MTYTVNTSGTVVLTITSGAILSAGQANTINSSGGTPSLIPGTIAEFNIFTLQI